jgi:hypothetical protein
VSGAVPVAGENAQRPLASYAALMGAFLGAFGGLIVAVAARGGLPERMSPYDLALAGTAGHKLSRLIATDEVTAPLRAPFVVVFETGDGEKHEEPRGDGPRRAIGQLVTCPSCVGQWTTAAFVVGIALSPRVSRLTASVFVADAISDFLHVAYRASKDRA